MASPSKEASIIMALKALKKDEKLSLRAAAKIYDVSRTTLKRRRDSTPSWRDIKANSCKLTDLKEKTLLDYIVKLNT